jgi:GxxExxY protein
MYVHDPLTQQIIGCAIAVHRVLGPGLMEATYEEALCIELAEERLGFSRQVGVPVTYSREDDWRIPSRSDRRRQSGRRD